MKKFWQSFKTWMGNLWGKSSTLLLALGLAISSLSNDPYFAKILTFMPKIGLYVAIAGVAIGMLRQFAPPPPSVTIKDDDSVHVDSALNIVTIAKAEPLPASVVTKACGEKV